MRQAHCAIFLLFHAISSAQAQEINEPSKVFEAIGGEGLRNPAIRAEAVRQIRLYSEDQKARGQARAKELGLPFQRFYENGRMDEVVGIDGRQPLYRITHNANAAISSGADVIRTNYSIDGAGLVVGVWDGGSARVSHQEFGSRVTSLDGAASIDHATHVVGTIAAAGTQAAARGMAPSITVDSYDWNNDLAEMTNRGASAPNQAEKIYISNHSYGFTSGWSYVNGGSPNRVWEWWGNGTTNTSSEDDFGRYNTQTRDQDSLAFNAPYYLIFRSAGNERLDMPSTGQLVALAPGSSTVVAYDPALHPRGDGSYRGGYETMAFDSLAKNVMTVGAVNDAVSAGERSVANASMTSFSSWGPTDDGRIKPDIVANGASVYSSTNGSDASYASYDGTSMSSPSAAGTAALLTQIYGNLFPSQAMLSSSLKGLIIHTADDLGNPGPDYQNGWGLINASAAAELLSDQLASPAKKRLNEGVINTTTQSTINQEFVWDGTSLIRATLCWTDPAGTSTPTVDLRSARLRNNLNLKIIGPDGGEHLPYIMPFVGTWTQESMSLPATRGINNTDNIEQVFIPLPPALGVYRAVITYSGTLTNNTQNFSLLISGSANETPPPPALAITSISPATALPSSTLLTLQGLGFTTGTQIKLTQSGQPDIEATSETLTNGAITCQVQLSTAAAGLWNIVATNPNNETATLANRFTVISAIWSSTFDGSTSGWSSTAVTGTNPWTTSTAKSHSPNTSFYSIGTIFKTTTRLTSPNIAIPQNASNLQIRFWHDFVTQLDRDGGRIEFSLNGGTWFSPGENNSGSSFTSNGYTGTISGTGQPIFRSDFVGKSAWSGNSNGFIESVINLTDTAMFAGKNLRISFLFATNTSVVSTGWYVDSIALVGGGNLSNATPTITQTANTDSTSTVTNAEGINFDLISANQANLSVQANDDGGENALIYTWTASHEQGAAVSYSANQTNAAKNTTVFFEATGDYLFTVTATDASGSSVSSNVAVRVQQSPTGLRVLPAQQSITYGASQAFTATLLDQFDQAMATQPTSYQWTTSAGIIDPSGRFSNANAGGPYVITAKHLTYQGTASVTVTPAALAISLGSLQHTYDGNAKSASTSTNPSNIPISITYDGSTQLPILPGNYIVVATSADPNYQGQASATLTITDPYDRWKLANFSTEQIQAGLGDKNTDADQDRFTNWMEYHLGFNPNDAQSKLLMTIQKNSQNEATLTINQVVSNGSFRLQTSPDLQGDWTVHPVMTISQNQANYQVIVPTSTDRMFYRLAYTAPPIAP